MTSKYRYIIIGIVACLLGLTLGYFIFGNASSNSRDLEHAHNDQGSEKINSDQIWTCSMHPQIRQNEPGDCPICGMDLIPLESGNSNNPFRLEMTEEAVKLSNIQTTFVGGDKSKIDKNIRLSGKIQPDERLTSSQVVHIPGRIEKLYVSFKGEQISKGQKIATIYSPELISAQRELLEAIKIRDLNPSLVDAAREKLFNWKIDSVQLSQIELTGKIQNTFTIYADASGIVTKRRVAVGDYVKLGEPLFELVNLNRVWVLFDVYEEDLPHFKKGDRINFTTPSMPGETFSTEITFIDPVIDPDTRTVSVRTEFKNYSGKLKPEMLVYGQLNKKAEVGVSVSVPKSAVMWTGKRSVVYVKVPEVEIPSFEFREVELGESYGDNYQIVKGLSKGEEIVINGSFTIDAAAQLNNQSSMMNRSVMVKKKDDLNILPNYIDSTPVLFKQQLNDLLKSYLNLKDALVETNSEKSAEAAHKLLARLESMDSTLLKGEIQSYWMEQYNSIKAHGLEIKASEDIEIQRKQFDFLSQAIIVSVKVFGLNEMKLYVQHCPMANDNKGADWISGEEAIRNPYFGDKMMKCGKVKSIIN